MICTDVIKRRSSKIRYIYNGKKLNLNKIYGANIGEFINVSEEQMSALMDSFVLRLPSNALFYVKRFSHLSIIQLWG